MPNSQILIIVDGNAETAQSLAEQAEKAGHRIGRITIGFEAGRDGFWLARWLRGRGG
jgi:hypothetical protein